MKPKGRWQWVLLGAGAALALAVAGTIAAVEIGLRTMLEEMTR
jgi:hypothetical protein